MTTPEGFRPERRTERDLDGLAARLAGPAADGRPRRRRGSRPVVRAGLVALASVVVVAGSGIVVAAQEAMPGSALYGVKRATERALLAMPFDDEHLRLQLALRRMAEAEARPTEAEELLEDAAAVLGPVDDGPGKRLLEERIEERRGGSPDGPPPGVGSERRSPSEQGTSGPVEPAPPSDPGTAPRGEPRGDAPGGTEPGSGDRSGEPGPSPDRPTGPAPDGGGGPGRVDESSEPRPRPTRSSRRAKG